ncbi:hypothetical protein AB0F52_15205 [Amycolatopsis sp. NPDC024027]|uniref:hypothetical protein n=1 Tax=Amycolatopsis sp. NPDC024027 TaxID=3154327 RepID=UPI0033FAA476
MSTIGGVPTHGVCLIRIEAQLDGLLVTVRIDENGRRRGRHFTNVDDAVAMAREFLETFVSD